MSTPEVIWQQSTLPGAPELYGTPGGRLIAVLKAALIDGFGSVNVSGLVVVSNVATATVNAGHGFADSAVILVAGATPSELNGLKRITYVSSTQFQFAATGVADGTATGTITAKVAPAPGWDIPFEDAPNFVCVFRQTDLSTSQCYYRISDAAGAYARITGYSSMSDVNTGTNAFQHATGGGYWPKGSAASTARTWYAVASKVGVYLFGSFTDGNYASCAYFGDFIPFESSDLKRGMISCYATASGVNVQGVGMLGAAHGCRLQTARNQTTVSVDGSAATSFAAANGSYLGNAAKTIWSSGTKYVEPVSIYDNASGAYYMRGFFPGLYGSYHANISMGNFETYRIGGIDRRLVYWANRGNASNLAYGFIDTTGPW